MAYTDYNTISPTALMSLTDLQYQQLALDECNLLADPAIATSASINMPLWWGMYLNKGSFLCYWYCRRALCAYLLGMYRKRRTVKIGTDTFKNEDLITNIEFMIKYAQTEIDRLDPVPGDYVESFAPAYTEYNMDSVGITGLALGYDVDYLTYNYQNIYFEYPVFSI